VNVPRLVAAVAVAWACLLSVVTGFVVWQNLELDEVRHDRICESLDRFAVFLAEERDWTDAELAQARVRLTVALECDQPKET
jgi:hypothetical protein